MQFPFKTGFTVLEEQHKIKTHTGMLLQTLTIHKHFRLYGLCRKKFHFVKRKHDDPTYTACPPSLGSQTTISEPLPEALTFI